MPEQSRHIALFLPSLSGGGAQRVMVTLANGFIGRGLKVDLVLAEAEGPYLSDVNPAVRVIDLGHKHVSRSLLGLIAYLRRERPHALLSALNHANVIAWIAVTAANTGTRLVVSEHNSISRSIALRGTKSRVLLKMMAWAYSRVDKVVAVSGGVAGDLQNILALRADKLQTIYNPIVTEQLLEKASEPVAGFPDGPVILAVGRMTKQKDYPTLIRAFAVASKSKRARLIILGEGELRPDLEKLSRELGVANRVLMPGFVANPYAWMRAADLFVLSSAWEGLSTVLVEAMACGTRVVSTDCPNGPAEILENGKWGRLVPVGDIEALALAMLQALKEPSTLDVRVRAAHFNAELAIDQYASLLLSNQPT